MCENNDRRISFTMIFEPQLSQSTATINSDLIKKLPGERELKDLP